jgi:hypothetical protein
MTQHDAARAVDPRQTRNPQDSGTTRPGETPRPGQEDPRNPASKPRPTLEEQERHSEPDRELVPTPEDVE